MIVKKSGKLVRGGKVDSMGQREVISELGIEELEN
jgi:hypothetical protein